MCSITANPKEPKKLGGLMETNRYQAPEKLFPLKQENNMEIGIHPIHMGVDTIYAVRGEGVILIDGGEPHKLAIGAHAGRLSALEFCPGVG
jgi:hypothetical protein